MESREMHTAVITGPTGAVGVALCNKLLRDGVRVYAIVRPDSPRSSALPNHPGLTAVRCGLHDLSGLPALMAGTGIDAFFHLAWAGTTGEARNDVDLQTRNVQAAVQAVRAAKALGCEVFIGAGSQAEYGRCESALSPDTPAFPETGYGIAKLCAGQMTRLECRRLGLRHVWVRILSVYGPHQDEASMLSTAIRKLLAGESPALTAGRQTWDFLYSDDAADALWRCALRGRDGAVYPLGSGRALPLRQYVEALRDAIDPALPLEFGAIPYGTGQVMHLEADIAALRADTGFEPTTPFELGIRKTIDWMRSVK